MTKRTLISVVGRASVRLDSGEDLTPDVLCRISAEFDELLLPYAIDRCIFGQIANPDLVEHIHRVGITFYEKVSID